VLLGWGGRRDGEGGFSSRHISWGGASEAAVAGACQLEAQYSAVIVAPPGIHPACCCRRCCPLQVGGASLKPEFVDIIKAASQSA
jgi:hypothetical protein